MGKESEVEWDLAVGEGGVRTATKWRHWAGPLAMAALACVLAACSDSAAGMRKKTPDFSLSMTDFLQEFRDSKLSVKAFESKYNGKVIDLSDSEVMYDPALEPDKKTVRVLVKPPSWGDYWYVQCIVADDAIPEFNKVSSGMKLTLRGRLKEIRSYANGKMVPFFSSCVQLK